MQGFIFYVYEHWRPDTGACFYVGKGKGKRAWDIKNQRNRYHKAITSKLISLGMAIDVRIVMRDLSAETAYALEIDRIALYGQANLANMTRGGEGLINPSADTRRMISEKNKAKWEDPEYRARMKIAHSNRPTVGAVTRAKLSAVSKGRKRLPETIKRMKAAAKIRGIPRSTIEAGAASRRGKPRVPHRPESKELMRAAAFARPTKVVVCQDDGLIFTSVKAAADHYGAQAWAIYDACLGKKPRAVGRRFKYQEAA